ncbi:hypothetical protein ACFQQB_37560 [Nonomuraea rubra]|uniref:hypothetical protein n=1 Tax=Nonomuraea rubra TaxID=46180 RepID=UPI00360F333A
MARSRTARPARCPLEREVPLAEAGRRSVAALAALGLRAELADVGGGVIRPPGGAGS